MPRWSLLRVPLMSALDSVQAAALLAVADVVEEYAEGIYIDVYSSDVRGTERDAHLKEHFLALAQSLREREDIFQCSGE